MSTSQFLYEYNFRSYMGQARIYEREKYFDKHINIVN